ncbi:hypothetical protein FQN55_003374 [Onygenales sp. PD_40]|nr:hypothetical protein FQN55_003374 [Onygenales sp. PD_40]KAK2791135.1 hypothetical protein FQN52_005091 [Onygenales sp. PD_12]KAK2799637.1 hypothetical protein FQN51_006769 [Onygenales sp. PD_10]
MPELSEIARVVHFIRKYLVGKTITKVHVQDDPIVFGKAGTTAAEFQKNIQGKTVADAGQQGKYFWMIMSSPPHPVMHFGMTGWLKIKDADTHYYRSPTQGNEPWPPKFWKFMLEMDDSAKTEAAFVDARRLGRVRLVDCPGADIRKHTPLKENGPDPVLDKDTVSVDWLIKKLGSKRVPIKALLLDQANISGLGNWMGDEVLYHAKIHPEQYSNTLQPDQIKQLHSSIHYVCSTSVDLLGNSDQFPDDWLFNHRWSKGKKNHPQTLPNGDKIVFVTVGGRTSAVVPAVQKKTGPVAGDVGDEEAGEKTPKKRGRAKKEIKDEESGEEDEPAAPKRATTKKAKAEPKVKDEQDETPKAKGTKRKAEAKPAKKEVKSETPAGKRAKTTDLKESSTPLRRGRSAKAGK